MIGFSRKPLAARVGAPRILVPFSGSLDRSVLEAARTREALPA